jgi:hypothetical protein
MMYVKRSRGLLEDAMPSLSRIKKYKDEDWEWTVVSI